MAPREFHSPLHTSHDTLGTDTLGTPMFMPSSPPRMSRIPQRLNRKAPPSGLSRVESANAARRRNQRSRSSSPSRNGDNSEMGLNQSEYTLDLSKLPGGELGDIEKDLDPLPDQAVGKEEDELSEIGGPEDFTLNMEKWMKSSAIYEKEGDKAGETNEKTEGQREGGNDVKEPKEGPSGPSAEDAADLGEYSEFGPPLDMSTPAHVLSGRKELSKDGTRLADIEEQPAESPAGRKSAASEKSATQSRAYINLQTKFEDLREELREKDELLKSSRTKLLEARSAADQIQHLQSVVQMKNKLLEETTEKLEGESSLHNRIQQLQSELDLKKPLSEESGEQSSQFTSLQQQVQLLQRELNSKVELLNAPKEDSTTLSNLRRENEYLREQLAKRDAALEDNMTKMAEVTAAKQQQTREKNTEIEDLKARQDEQYLQIEKLESQLDSVNQDYDSLDEQTETLQERYHAAERHARALQSEISTTKATSATQYDAIKMVAIHHAIEIGNKNFMEIVECLKTSRSSNTAASPSAGGSEIMSKQQDEINRLERELGDVRSQLQESNSSKDIVSLKLEHTQELLSESRTFINTVEGENKRLVSRVDSLTSELARAQDSLASTTQRLDNDRATIDGLRQQIQTQQPNLPPSPPTSTNTSTHVDHSTINEMHQAELTRLGASHTAAISSLRDSHAESTQTLHNLLAASQSRESDLKSQLHSLQDTASSQKILIEKLDGEVRRLRSTIEDKDAASVAMDVKFANSTKRREEKWEARVEALLKDRERMGKALLWTWGENEVGDVGSKVAEDMGKGVFAKGKGTGQSKGPCQGYRYKFAKRESTSS